MKTFTLPDPEETQVKIVSKGKEIVVEVFELYDTLVDARKDIEKIGISTDTPEGQLEYFQTYINLLKDKFDIHLNITSVVPFLSMVYKETDNLKKKFSSLSGSFDSTESTQEMSLEISENEN